MAAITRTADRKEAVTATTDFLAKRRVHDDGAVARFGWTRRINRGTSDTTGSVRRSIEAVTEGLEQALMSGLQQQAAAGQIPPLVLAKLISLVGGDKMELPEALNQVMEDAKAQAEADAAAQQQGSAADQAMATAGPAAVAGMPSIAGPSPNQQNLAGLMARLRQPAMTIVPGRNVAQGGV